MGHAWRIAGVEAAGRREPGPVRVTPYRTPSSPRGDGDLGIGPRQQLDVGIVGVLDRDDRVRLPQLLEDLGRIGVIRQAVHDKVAVGQPRASLAPWGLSRAG